MLISPTIFVKCSDVPDQIHQVVCIVYEDFVLYYLSVIMLHGLHFFFVHSIDVWLKPVDSSHFSVGLSLKLAFCTYM